MHRQAWQKAKQILNLAKLLLSDSKINPLLIMGEGHKLFFTECVKRLCFRYS